MSDQWESKEELIGEVVTLRQQVATLKQKEAKLRESEERYRSLTEDMLDNSEVGISILDADFKIIWVNHILEQYTGLHRDEIIGRDKHQLIHERIKHIFANPEQFTQETFQRYQNNTQGESFECHVLPAAGRDERWLEHWSQPIQSGLFAGGLVEYYYDITKHKQSEKDLQQRNRELALLYRAGKAFSSTLDLDKILKAVLEEVRHLLGVVACSIWLIDRASGELVCRQVTNLQSEIVRGWRLAPGQGIAGWTARHGQSVIVPDTRQDERYYSGVDRQTGLEIRSILTVPLQLKRRALGVIQVVDKEVDRFRPSDLTLVESLAAHAAVSIENARLYKEAQQNAQTKAMLLNEVSHRVKNNLSAIIGLLYAEQRYTVIEDQSTYKSMMKDLINRIQGLATAHQLLSDSEWRPLPLSDLAERVVQSSLKALPPGKHMQVEVSPSPQHVTPKQANSLALVINELVTNTIKYAMRDRRKATIVVEITIQNGTIVFEFHDDGPGYPEEVLRLERESVGLYLMQTLVHNDLRGKLLLANHNGAVTRVQFQAMA